VRRSGGSRDRDVSGSDGVAGPHPEDAFDLLLLQELPGVGPVTVRHLLERFGTPERALTAPSRDFTAIAGWDAARARSEHDLRRTVRGALSRAGELGMRVVTWTAHDYPDAMRRLADPPPVLFLRGRADLLGRPQAVTVVGARRATGRARDVAERLGARLARAGVTVVSGLALGVDGAAHVGALGAHGDTIAVLGTGADVAYPRAHRRLFERIAATGLLVSEFMPGTRAAPHHFPRRNRLLAAISSIVVVVEAGRRSGSLITVDHALDLGRDVWAVPGPIDASVCEGSNRLLVDGAQPLVSIDDFVARVAGEREAAATGEGAAGKGRTDRAEAPDALGADEGGHPVSSLEERALATLEQDTLLVDDLAERLAVPVSTALALLTTLELHGEVVRLPGMRFRKAA